MAYRQSSGYKQKQKDTQTKISHFLRLSNSFSLIISSLLLFYTSQLPTLKIKVFLFLSSTPTQISLPNLFLSPSLSCYSFSLPLSTLCLQKPNQDHYVLRTSP